MQMHNVSYVKIGGFDEEGAYGNVSGNPNFTFMTTESNKTWKLRLKEVMVFSDESDSNITTTWNDPRYV